jgi:hypothetical protein
MFSLLAQLEVGAVRHTPLQHDSETLPTGTISPVPVPKSCTSIKTALIDLLATRSLVLPLSTARLVSGFVVLSTFPLIFRFFIFFT